MSRLINGCCFPAVTALLNREMAALMRLQASSEAQQAPAGSSDAGNGVPSAAAQQQAQQQAQAAAAAGSAEAGAERCIAAARLQGAGQGSAGSASREAAFDLLLDLVTHDSGCWRQAQELLQDRVHHVAGQVGPPGQVHPAGQVGPANAGTHDVPLLPACTCPGRATVPWGLSVIQVRAQGVALGCLPVHALVRSCVRSGNDWLTRSALPAAHAAAPGAAPAVWKRAAADPARPGVSS